MGITNVLVVFVLVAGTGAVAEDTPSPALLVLHKGENAMAIVDPSNGKVVGHVPTGQDPHELVVSDDGKLAFASNYAAPGPRGATPFLSSTSPIARSCTGSTSVRSCGLTDFGSLMESSISRPREAWRLPAMTRRPTRSIGCSVSARTGPT